MNLIINICYFIVAILFILGLKAMTHPRSARQGIIVAGCGMLLAVLATFCHHEINTLENYGLILLAIIIGASIAVISGKKVKMTNMPQMIAIYNGMGGGAAAAIAAVELLRSTTLSLTVMILALIGAMVGSISFSGSVIAYAKLQGLIQGIFCFRFHSMINLFLTFAATLLAISLLFFPHAMLILSGFFALLLILGILFTTPIGGANMPIVISLFNAMTGLAVAFEGFVLNNAAMIIAGTVVGASGTLLTQLMAKAMNQSVLKILFTPHPTANIQAENSQTGHLKSIEPYDAAILLAYAKQIIIIPGYGLAVAQAQHKIWELTELLEERGVTVKFAIHPVAGRMPGHMNVLLAEAGVPYDKIYDLDEINKEFINSDVAIVIGANDVVNPSARTNSASPIYGMPILNADQAKNVIVIKRGEGKGFSGIENSLFYLDHARMLYGDAQKIAGQLIQGIKQA
ncbi:MAG: NAD(P)(+) transhydrogenase (Re/Si-specific) subunit beta [Legionellales bacterium]|nr:NAD(P)(+) transhydrogenase (Re/Si-specific) subunit beta [Legionellales bacterium]